MACMLKSFKLLQQLNSFIRNMRILLSKLLANVQSISTVDPKIGIQYCQNISFGATYELIVDGQRDIVRKAFIRN